MQHDFLERLGIKKINSGACFGEWIENPDGEIIPSINPSTEEVIAEVKLAGTRDYEVIIEHAEKAFLKWQDVPAPKRGAVVEVICHELRKYKSDLGKLISLEMGKIQKEGEGEVQEVIDLEKITGGLSRGPAGEAIKSEREHHELHVRYDPLGIVGIITAFNFPVAVAGWNWTHALTQGDSVLIKPSLLTPLSAIAVQHICNRVLQEQFPRLLGVFNLCIGVDPIIGEGLINDSRIPLISFTGSTKVGRHVSEVVARRLGRSLLELGGNNPVIILEDADIDLALENVFFGFIGTTGQRCTSTRRVFVHKNRATSFIMRLLFMAQNVRFGDPLDPRTVAGPLINEDAVKKYLSAIQKAKEQGGEMVLRGGRTDRPGFFVTPTIVYVPGRKQLPIMREETFAPLLYIMEIDDVDEGITLANDALQQLSSGIFTNNDNAIYRFLRYGKAGIRNNKCGTGGAESSTPFGGNFHTGWGREAGGDAWKNYVLESGGVSNHSGKTIYAQNAFKSNEDNI